MTSVKVLVLVMAVWNLAEAQRSFYASRPRSKLLPRFKQNETETTTGNNLVNREGEEENLFGNAPGVDNRNQELEGTLEDQKFLNRVAQWPEDRQPFWFKNRKVISSARGQEAIAGNSNQQSFGTRVNPQFQIPFAGNRVVFNKESGNGQISPRRRNYEELDLPSRVNFVRNRPKYLARDY